jgi:hypothetical protein
MATKLDVENISIMAKTRHLGELHEIVDAGERTIV